MSVAQELLTGHWSWEGSLANPFPSNERVDFVDKNGDEVHYKMHGSDYRPSAACDYAREALQRTVHALSGLENANVTISTGGGGP